VTLLIVTGDMKCCVGRCISVICDTERNYGIYSGADKSLVLPTSRCILFDGENISFDASLAIYINSTNIPPIMIINRIYANQNLLSL
jgi:hypothetical protein